VPAVLLIRHAQASYGTHDYDVLSERGAEQAAAVHAALEARGVRPDRVVSGSLRRQRDTALPWTSAGASLDVDPRLDEYDASDLLAAHSESGASLERGPDDEPPSLQSRDFQAILDEALHAWIAAGAGGGAGETWTAFRDRVSAALRDVVAGLGSGETAFVITSGGVIAACCVLALGVPEQTFVALNHVTVNAGVTKLVSGRRGVSLVSFNEHAHLERDGLVTYR